LATRPRLLGEISIPALRAGILISPATGGRQQIKILILGGTRFLGRAIVDAALASGHTLTLFNRGQSGPELFPGVEALRGDRTADLSALAGRDWDAVVDPSGYFPRVVGASADALRDHVGQYVFISSISVYAKPSASGEEDPVGTTDDPTVETITGGTYGPLKALCEQAAAARFPDQSLIIRPGLIVGPHDPTDRFSYWPWRIAQGGEVLAPGRPERGVQVIDARDLAAWTLRMIETRATGVFNATSPAGAITLGELLETAQRVSGSDARVTWVEETWLLGQGVAPWSEMPVWVPEFDPEMAGFFDVPVARAVAAGLTFRPIETTVRDTLAWLATRPTDHVWRAGLTRAREAALRA
jgi:2'-hydroxyisoflavone reductase